MAKKLVSIVSLNHEFFFGRNLGNMRRFGHMLMKVPLDIMLYCQILIHKGQKLHMN